MFGWGCDVLRVLGVICVVIAAVSCSGSGDRNLVLAYGKAVREIGLFPVYPPREEFQVGDVYMWSQSLSDPNDTVSVYLMTIDWLRMEADRFMASRIVFNNSATAVANTPRGSPTDIPGKSRNLALRGHADLALAQSLPIAAFPTVTADAGYTASAGFVGALAAIGIGGGSRTTVTLNFNDVRTYFVPNAPVMRKVLAELPNVAMLFPEGEVDLGRLVQQRRGKGTDPCRAGRRCGVSVVTRVFLTRQIDYTYRNAQILAVALRRAQNPGTLSSVQAAPDVNISVQTNNTGAIDGAHMDKQIRDLKTQVDALAAGSTPGQSFRFEAWDARGVTFASSYQRPVVVGWDGIELGFGK